MIAETMRIFFIPETLVNEIGDGYASAELSSGKAFDEMVTVPSFGW